MDPIADLLTRLRNANQRYHRTVSLPSSQLKRALVQVLEQEGYIQGFQEQEQGVHPKLVVELKYKGKRGKQRVLTGLQRVSKPSRRVYAGADEIPSVLNGLGVCILSTSQGLLTDRQARQRRVGGEVLCKVW